LIKDFFDRCHYQSFIKNFVKVFFDKENFDSDNGPLPTDEKEGPEEVTFLTLITCILKPNIEEYF